MSDNRTDLPSPNAPNFNQRLRETIQTYLGKQGNPLDRGLTLRDFTETGLLKLRDGFTLKPGGGSSILPLEPGPSLADEPDLTPPPTPTGFIATAAISHIIIEHDAPVYTQGRGHLRTRLYGRIVNAGDPLPTFADAVEIAQFDGSVYAHPSNPATTWHFWIKWETVDGVLSTDPAGGTNGVVATTGQDVSKLVFAMTGPGNPFKVVTEQLTLPDGTVVPVGTYTADGFIHNGQITNAMIANLAVDSAKIASVSADKVTAGSIAVGQYIQSAGYVAGESGWRINGNGNAEFSNAVVRGTVYATDGQFIGEVLALGAGGNKARMWAGDFEVYKQVPNVGLVLYKALSRVESGVGANNVQVTIPGYFLNQPRVIVSPANIKLYDAAYANQSQSIQCEVRDLIESPAGSMVWKFTPLATLSLAANTGQTVINQTSGVISTNWTSSQYTTQANTTKITPSVSLASFRGTGTSGVYFYRTVRWRVEYLSGGSWVAGAWTTTNLGADANASTTTTATFTFPSAGTWTFRIYAEAYDTSTATFGSIAYETATDTISRTGNVTQTIQSWEETSRSLNYTPTYSLPSGWSIVSIKYTYVYSYEIIKYGTGNCSIAGDEFYLFSNGSGSNLSASSTNSSNTLSFTLSSTFDAFGQGAYVTMTMHSVTGTVTRRRPAPSSTTPSNTFSLNSYSYELTSAQVLATGTLNWVAIGE